MSRRSMEERRNTILSVALKLFTEKGYFNTSVHDIQADAQVSIGSIYHHFGNKEAIAKALFLDLEEKMNEAISGIKQSHDTAHDRCKAVISYLFSLSEAQPRIMQYMLCSKHREFLPNEKPVCSSRPFALMKEMVGEGMAKGEIRKMDINVAAVSVFGASVRLISLRMDGVLEHPLEYYLDECWACAWRGVEA